MLRKILSASQFHHSELLEIRDQLLRKALADDPARIAARDSVRPEYHLVTTELAPMIAPSPM